MSISNNLKLNFSKDKKSKSFKKFEKILKSIMKNISYPNNTLNILSKNFNFNFKLDRIGKF